MGLPLFAVRSTSQPVVPPVVMVVAVATSETVVMMSMTAQPVTGELVVTLQQED